MHRRDPSAGCDVRGGESLQPVYIRVPLSRLLGTRAGVLGPRGATSGTGLVHTRSPVQTVPSRVRILTLRSRHTLNDRRGPMRTVVATF